MATNFPTALDVLTNPTPADKLNTPAVLHTTQHTNINDTIESIEAKLGITFSNVSTSIDFITNILLLSQGIHPTATYKEVTGTILPTSIIWYTDVSKTIKVLEKNIVYSTSIRVLPETLTLKLYDGTLSNVVKRTIVDSITYNRVFEASRTRTIT